MKDVIVVGAGPAGTTAATALARQGFDVLLVDRHRFPRDKCCGDGVAAAVLDLLEDLGVSPSIRAAGFYPVHGFRFVAPRGFILDMDRPNSGIVAPRIRFDALLQAHAVQSGATFLQARAIRPLIHHGRITGVRVRGDDGPRDIPARLVIGADGAASILARELHGRWLPRTRRAIAIRAYIDGVQILPNRTEFYTNTPVSHGYGWLFPTGANSANIGIGVRMDIYYRNGLQSRRMLNAFLAQPGIRDRLNPDAKPTGIKVGTEDFCVPGRVQRVFDGALLIGDAAAWVDPLDGGGMVNAIVSARVAAAVGARALRAGNVTRDRLADYARLCAALLLPRARRRYLIRTGLTAFPFLLDWLARRASTHDTFLRSFIEYSYAAPPLRAHLNAAGCYADPAAPAARQRGGSAADRG